MADRGVTQPEALEFGPFAAWQGYVDRLRTVLEADAGPAERYRDLMLITNVMNAQFEVVSQRLDEASDELSSADPDDTVVAEAQELVAWSQKWLPDFQARFEYYRGAREEARRLVSSEQRDWAEAELDPLFEEIKSDVRSTLLAQIEALKERLREG